ncbi:hypothetical protein ACLOJK_033583, partial [Asimina triloba]
MAAASALTSAVSRWVREVRDIVSKSAFFSGPTHTHTNLSPLAFSPNPTRRFLYSRNFLVISFHFHGTILAPNGQWQHEKDRATRLQ